MELSPHDAYINGRCAAFYTFFGQPERAFELLDEAETLDPYPPVWCVDGPWRRLLCAGGLSRSARATRHTPVPDAPLAPVSDRRRWLLAKRNARKSSPAQRCSPCSRILPSATAVRRSGIGRCGPEHVDRTVDCLRAAGGELCRACRRLCDSASHVYVRVVAATAYVIRNATT